VERRVATLIPLVRCIRVLTYQFANDRAIHRALPPRQLKQRVRGWRWGWRWKIPADGAGMRQRRVCI
jgi:hypothetical protein